jgi:hypothetical protein
MCHHAEGHDPNAPDASVDADANTDSPGRAPDVTPGGKPHCKNDAANARAPPRTPRNSPVERTFGRQNLRTRRLGAYPRTPSTPPSGQPGWSPSHAGVADTAGSAGVAARDRPRWPGNTDLPSRDANAPQRDYTLRCNTAIADATAQTAARTP